MWRGLGSPLGKRGGESRRGGRRASNAPPRSPPGPPPRWARPLPVIAPAIATSASAAAISANAPPSASGSAWPSSRLASMLPPWRLRRVRGALKRANSSHLATEPFRAPQAVVRMSQKPTEETRCRAHARFPVHRFDSRIVGSSWALPPGRRGRAAGSRRADRASGSPPRREPDARQDRPDHDQGPHPLQPQRREERQVHLHRLLPLGLAPADGRRPACAHRPGQARHRRSDPKAAPRSPTRAARSTASAATPRPDRPTARGSKTSAPGTPRARHGKPSEPTPTQPQPENPYPYASGY